MFYDIFVQLCEQKGVKPSRAAVDAGVPKSAVSNWKSNWEKGIEAFPNQKNAVSLANYFGVSVDYLLGNQQNEKAPANAEAKDEYEISHFMEALESSGTLMYDGVPISDAAKESIRAAMRLGLEAAKIESKKKFTPKKYRKD